MHVLTAACPDEARAGRQDVRASLAVPHERIGVVDAWRGFALLGVCIVNFINVNALYLSPEVAEALPTAGVDWRVAHLVFLLMANKFNTIFTLLFGMGVAIMAQRVRAAGAAENPILLRRMLGLLAIGWLHFLVLFPGDLLHIYAICGMALLLVRQWPDRWLFIAGVMLAVVGRLLYEERLLLGSLVPALAQQGWFGQLQTLDAEGAIALRYGVLQAGSALDLLQANATYALEAERDLLRRTATGIYYFGRMLIGFVLWRSGAIAWLLTASRTLILRIALVMLFAIALAHVALSVVDFGPLGEVRHAAMNLLRQCVILIQGGSYLVVVLWLWRRFADDRWRIPLCAVGRMSLSNYLLQSVVMVAVLYGPGLRLAGDIGVLGAAAIGLATYVALAWCSVRYLRRHEQGPAEWLWRQMTYGLGSSKPRLARQY